jgi:hypothetical protein
VSRAGLFIGALVALLAGCDLPCNEDSDCFGTTPVCDTRQCFCTARCDADDDCNVAEGFTCNAAGFCSPADEAVDPGTCR